MKAWMKKYHIIGYLITMAVLVLAGYLVKWHHCDPVFAKYGDQMYVLYRYFNIVFVLLLAAVSLLYYLIIIRKAAIEKIVLAAGLSIGIIFMLLSPPHTPADEDKHMYIVNSYANMVMGVGLTEEPNTAYYRECDADSGFTREISVDNFLRMIDQFWEMDEGSEYVVYESDPYGYYPLYFIFYLPAIIGVVLARLIGLGPVLMYLLARFLMLLAYVWLGYVAVKKIPAAKPLFALVVLLPTCLYRAASVSRDGLVHAAVFVFLAYAVSLIKEHRLIRPKEAVVLALSGLYMVVGKGGAYAPLLLLLFLIPKENFGSRIKYGYIIAGSVLLCIGGYLAVNPNMAVALTSTGKNKYNELSWTDEECYTFNTILSQPVKAVKTFLNTFVYYWDTWLSEMVSGGYGWMQFNSAPWLIVGYMALMGYAASVESDLYLTKKQKTVTGIAVVFGMILVILSMWLFETPISYGHVAGIQGRYFIPLLFPALLLLRSRKIRTSGEGTYPVLWGMVLVLCGVLFDIWLKITV